MLTGEQTETCPATDSCQTAVIATPVTVMTSDSVQTAAYANITSPAPIRKSFEEQQPAIFFIVGFAIVYIAMLIIRSIIKTRRAHN